MRFGIFIADQKLYDAHPQNAKEDKQGLPALRLQV